VLQQQDQDFQGDTFQLQDATAAAQSPGSQIELEVFTEPDRLRQSNGMGSHDTPGEVERFYTTLETST